MTALVDAALRSSLVLALVLLALPLLRRRSAALRHALLAAALVTSGLAVPLGWLTPEWPVNLPMPVAIDSMTPLDTAPPASRAGGPADAPGLDLVTLAGWTWAFGALVLLASLGLSCARLHGVAAAAVPLTDARWLTRATRVATVVGLPHPLVLLQTEWPGFVATFGVRRPRLIVPAQALEWSDARIDAVLRHEAAHVRRYDWTLQLVAETLTACYWPNPLFWIACRRLRLESERACDDAVLRGGAAPADYAEDLLGIAALGRVSRARAHVAAPMARPSTLRRRITAMLHPDSARDPVSRRAVLLVAALSLTLLFPLAAIRAERAGARPLAGFVYDPSGAVLPGAAVTLQGGEEQWETTTDDTGRFEFALVEAGRYQLRVALPGFRLFTTTLELGRERDWQRAITLQVGSVQEEITVREQRPATVAPAATTPVRVRVGGNLRPPRKVQDVKPVYPASMRDAGLEGVVPLEAVIDRNGDVRSVRVLTAAVHADFARAATDAVRQWRFDPTLLNGEPVEVVMTVTVNFELEE